MSDERIQTARLELRPLPAVAAAALPGDRETAQRLVGATLPDEWPQVDLLDVLPLQAAAPPDGEAYGVWVIVERDSLDVVGDAGYMGPPDEDGCIEIGYSIVPSRRNRGYAGEAVAGLLAWAREQAGVRTVVAGCDPGNAPSIRVLERSGFERSGEQDGELRWRLRG